MVRVPRPSAWTARSSRRSCLRRRSTSGARVVEILQDKAPAVKPNTRFLLDEMQGRTLGLYKALAS